MKVLYLASNPEKADTLALEKEISELQRRFLIANSAAVQFVFLPSVSVEQLALEIERVRPDILHLSSHGNQDALTLKDEAGAPVAIDGKLLPSFLDPDNPPRLIYLNACDSKEIARDLAEVVPVSIGTTAPISNKTARSGAVRFYERILQGASVQKAYEDSAAMVRAMSRGAADSEIFPRAGIDTRKMTFHQIPRIVARFNRPPRDMQTWFSFYVGLVGCPENTIQAIMYTTDMSFVHYSDEEMSIEQKLTVLTMERPVNGELWWWDAEDAEWGDILGDFDLFACGTMIDRRQFVASSTLCDALTLYYTLEAAATDTQVSPNITSKIAQLRSNNGAIIGRSAAKAAERRGAKKKAKD